MSETEYLKGRLDALSLIVGAIFAQIPQKDARFKPRLVNLANQYLVDAPLETRSSAFRSGFQREFDQIIAALDSPDVKKGPDCTSS